MSHSFNLLAVSSQPTFLIDTWEFLLRGGIFMIPLSLCSMVGVMTILYKFFSLTRNRVIPTRLVDGLHGYDPKLNAPLSSAARDALHQGNSTLGRLAVVVIQNSGKSRSDITHAVETTAREEVVHLHAGISILDTLITIAPLLGLLGTASGLVSIFRALGDQADHLAIALGIAEALNTTIFGLAIAVPCVVAHGFFLRRIETFTAKLEASLASLTAACGSNSTQP